MSDNIGRNKQLRRTQCYRCSSRATSSEHFPPKSFFPNKGRGLQLRTVPSCDLHNNKKSNDDQYLLAQICMNVAEGENIAKKRFRESIAPQLKRRPAFGAALADGSEVLPDGKVKYKVDVARFDNFFDNLSAAVYFEHFNSQFDKKKHSMRHIYMNFYSDDDGYKRDVNFMNSYMKPFFDDFRNLVVRIEADKIDEAVYSCDIMAPVGAEASITIAHSFYGVFEVISLLTRIDNPFVRVEFLKD
ncbi:hypothetical protein GBZ48_10470 [Azospirillum melinis]|uniref:Uncharacterized protein n=1 Tax=Azospirillum melinis TaxID=328839 RepID=A0ABX2K7X4_9PROT|nr:hypothetical protein [Azospirillum melinis]MBP2304750.1 hypothetical protein [Azospirillum melinis]NUA99717.1 hypothetical protein [Azospirillum melinis]